ncbi:MAG: hypothetical protein ACC663_10350 [Gammaproteobacteria bacterium]
MKKLSLTLVLFTSLLLSGCYDLTEELWINPDGSGRMKFTVGLAENLVAMIESSGESANFCENAIKDKGKLEDNDLISSVVIKKSNEAGMFYCSIDIGVTDFRQFREVRNIAIEGDYDKYEFPFVIQELDGGRIRISQDFSNFGRDDPEQSDWEIFGQEMTMALMSPMLAGKYITVIVHAPKIESSNGEISADGKTTTWKKPLIDLVRYPDQKHEFEMIMVKDPGFLDRIKSWWDSLQAVLL